MDLVGTEEDGPEGESVSVSFRGSDLVSFRCCRGRMGGGNRQRWLVEVLGRPDEPKRGSARGSLGRKRS